VMVPNSLGPAKLLLHYGTEAQKDYYLPRLATGEEIPAFALTSPVAGSDAGAMTDTGIICTQDGVLGVRLNWEKRYITLGPIATVLGLAFKLYDPDKLIGDTENIGITVALIPTHTSGVSIGRRHNPLDSAVSKRPELGQRRIYSAGLFARRCRASRQWLDYADAQFDHRTRGVFTRAQCCRR